MMNSTTASVLTERQFNSGMASAVCAIPLSECPGRGEYGNDSFDHEEE